MSKQPLRPYVDWGRPGSLRYQRGTVITVRDPPPVNVRRLALEVIRRHNSIEPELQGTHRVLLRWSEREGTGLPNPDADVRETHYDPLPPDLQAKVTSIVDASPWREFTRKLYRTALTSRSLADELGITKTKLYEDRRAALWFYRGRFEDLRVYG